MELNITNVSAIPSPCYVIDYSQLIDNAKLIKQIGEFLGIKILLSIKGFPLPYVLHDLSTYFDGIAASGLYEATMAERMGKEIHIHSPVYKKTDMDLIDSKCSHIVFNSISQLTSYRQLISRCNHIGLRINPEYSEVAVDKYNPCLQYSRFGVTKSKIYRNVLQHIDGFHIHAMCEQDAESFARLIRLVTRNFGTYLNDISWINFGGGQLLTSHDYNVDCLVEPINMLKSDFGLEIYIEPCESVVSNCGYFVATVLDIVDNQKKTAILDTSATCHFPSVLEMPYTPDIVYPSNSQLGKYPYILAGCTCLSGDIIGEYRFNQPLKNGDRIVFGEMGAYTFCRANYFNGINIPDIVLYKENHKFYTLKHFTYQDYISTYTN